MAQANNQILINVDIGETRVALIENGVLSELYVERARERSPVGNIYLGKVMRVSYGMIWRVRPSKLKKTAVPALVVIGLTTVLLAGAATIGALRHEGVILAVLVPVTLLVGEPGRVNALVPASATPRPPT